MVRDDNSLQDWGFLIGAGAECRSKGRSANWRLTTVVMVLMRWCQCCQYGLPVPSRVPVLRHSRSCTADSTRRHRGKTMAATARHFDNVRHCRGAGLRDGWTGIRRHRGRAQSQGTEQSQNCCTHRSRPSKLHRNNDARSMQLVLGSTYCVKRFTEVEKFAQK